MPAKKTIDPDQIKRITDEIDGMDQWAEARILAYRSQRDSWQAVTYILLGISAATAIGAAISAGLKVQLWTVIFAGVSAGLSVINVSLRTPTQITKSETALTKVSALKAKITVLQTDSPNLSSQVLTRQLEQVRNDYQKALELPSPSERRLARVSAASQRMTRYERIIRSMRQMLPSSRILLQQAPERSICAFFLACSIC